MRKYIYLSIIVMGIILICITLAFQNVIVVNICLSIGTGLFSSALTAGLIDLSSYIRFKKRKSYRRKIELHYLSFHMLSLAQGVLKEYNNKNIKDLIVKLSNFKIDDNNVENVLLSIECHQADILKEIETIRKVQVYLSLSRYFDDSEIVFLCRSINYYSHIGKDNLNFILDNVSKYLDMFSDTYQ